MCIRDSYRVMAGQGTIGLEILEQLPDVDVILVPIGGGGLISGLAYAFLLYPSLKGRTGHFFPSILRKKRLSAQRGIDNRGGRGYHGSTWHRNKK